MKGCNDTITLWHRERIGGKDVFTRSVIRNCKWSEGVARSVIDGSAQNNSAYTAIIPNDGELVCAKGDIAALGVQETEITGEAGETAADLKRTLAPHIMTVESISDYTRERHGRYTRLGGV